MIYYHVYYPQMQDIDLRLASWINKCQRNSIYLRVLYTYICTSTTYLVRISKNKTNLWCKKEKEINSTYEEKS